MSDAHLEVDLLVLGGGMAGMSAAAWAADHGAMVLVAEKGPEIGGSAVLSGGVLWTGKTPQDFAGADPAQDPAFGGLLADGYDAGVEWMESLGVEVGPAFDLTEPMGFGALGRQFDILGHVRICRASVQNAGGYVVTGTEAVELLVVEGRVVGAMLRDRDALTEVRARNVLLATGGFQGGNDLVEKHVGPHANGLILRSNPESTGGGLRLAESMGGHLRAPAENFYGHLMPAPLPLPVAPSDFYRFSQMYSPRGLLLDKQGNRFVDESVAYYGNSVATARQPGQRALLIADDKLRQEELIPRPAMEVIDRPADAQRAGARVAIADTLEELEAQTAAWGYTGVAAGVARFNAEVTANPDGLNPPRWRARTPFVQAPWFAMEVQPSITFTFRGIATDVDGRVLDGAGQPIPGLLAAGADASFFNVKYFGGLAMALVFGLRAARAALGEG